MQQLQGRMAKSYDHPEKQENPLILGKKGTTVKNNNSLCGNIDF